jgi:hypothetical protein
VQASTTTPTTTLASTTGTRTGSDSIPLNRSAPDRKTIHNIPSRQHHPTTNTSAATGGINSDHRASTRNPASNTMGYADMNSRYQYGAMTSGSNSGAQSFLSKLSSKFARR